MGQLMPAESPRIAPSAPRYGPQGPSGGSRQSGIYLAAFCAPSSACRRSPYRTVWDELGYLHDHPATGEPVPACAGCLERSGDS
jgi:hypothetical protein